MKIEKLISIFEECIPTYQKAVDENWNYTLLKDNIMYSGLCLFIGKDNIYSKEYQEITEVFENYYKDFTNNSGYLFLPAAWTQGNGIKKCIKPRLKFLKQQIKELKKLQDEGYTDV